MKYYKNIKNLLKIAAASVLGALIFHAGAWAVTPLELQKKYEKQSAVASPDRGQKFFTSKHGKDWSCASCHTNVPNVPAEHIDTKKKIKPLAPSANSERFTDEAKVEKWFRRNCADVLGRECTAQEKADVISWLLTIK